MTNLSFCFNVKINKGGIKMKNESIAEKNARKEKKIEEIENNISSAFKAIFSEGEEK